MLAGEARHGLRAYLRNRFKELAARIATSDVFVQFAHLRAAELTRHGEGAHFFKMPVPNRPESGRNLREFPMLFHGDFQTLLANLLGPGVSRVALCARI